MSHHGFRQQIQEFRILALRRGATREALTVRPREGSVVLAPPPAPRTSSTSFALEALALAPQGHSASARFLSSVCWRRLHRIVHAPLVLLELPEAALELPQHFVRERGVGGAVMATRLREGVKETTDTM